MLQVGLGISLATRPGRRALQTGVVLLCLTLAGAAWAKKQPKTVTTVDGRPIRKVYVLSASADTATSVATQLTEDTCLTAVSKQSQADAVLDVGISLPDVGGGLPMPNVFAPSAQEQTLGNAKTQPQRSASANCTDRKDGGCTGSSTGQGGDMPVQLGSSLVSAGSDGEMDISLASPGKASQELWEPEAHTKRSWADQLRVAAGCPVCPGEPFKRRRGQKYREWMQAKCPALLAAAGGQ